jgi:hypothetical protein
MAVTAAHGAATGRNWRRWFFYAVEIVFAVIAATGEGFMYASYSPNGVERWPEAIARATITQIIIVMFGVAAIEAWRIRNVAARVFFTLVIWGVTIGAGLVTFWFLLEAAQVFRDTAMLAPLQGATITLPNGAVIPNSSIDILLIAALPFFQTILNILAPIITADHAPETLEQQQERQAREEAMAEHKARIAALRTRGWGAAIGGGLRVAKASLSGDDTSGYDGTEPRGNDDPNREVSGGDTTMYDSASGQAGYGAKAPVSIKRGSWTSRQLKDYARETYGVEVSDIEAANTMKVLSKGRKSGAAYVASSRMVKAWVDERYSTVSGAVEPTGTSQR